jgi:DNA invertase Pin-like site-specific DNA recombinase
VHARPRGSPWNDPFARMFLQILGVIAEFEASLVRQRTREGMAIVRQNGRLRGKQPRLKPAQDREIRRMHDRGDCNIAEIAALAEGCRLPRAQGAASAQRCPARAEAACCARSIWQAATMNSAKRPGRRHRYDRMFDVAAGLSG